MEKLYPLLETGSGVETVLDTSETEAVTDDAIQGVQTVTSMLHLPTWFGRALFIVLVIILTLALVRIINKIFSRTTHVMQEAGNSNITLISFARYVVLVLVYFFCGIIIVSSIPGASDSLNALLASGGILAVVIGFAGQDALSNIAGGVMILAFKPFVIGDFVRYMDANVSGKIEDISLRHTAIRTAENKRVIIPNGKINDAVIENANYADDHVCEFFQVGITYESDMEHAIEILREEVLKQPLHLDPRNPITEMDKPEVKVEVIELADSAVILRAWLWAHDFDSAIQLKFTLNHAVKKRFDAEGIDFAYPHLTITQ